MRSKGVESCERRLRLRHGSDSGDNFGQEVRPYLNDRETDCILIYMTGDNHMQTNLTSEIALWRGKKLNDLLPHSGVRTRVNSTAPDPRGLLIHGRDGDLVKKIP